MRAVAASAAGFLVFATSATAFAPAGVSLRAHGSCFAHRPGLCASRPASVRASLALHMPPAVLGFSFFFVMVALLSL